MSQKYFYNEPAIPVSQPFGRFYVVAIPASKLVEVSYSLPAKYGEDSLDGVQRGINKKRVENISKFCGTNIALFPNSIILAANILEDGSVVDTDSEWIVEDGHLLMPSSKPVASIVDGQHRVEGLKKHLNEGGEDIDLVCSVYLDMPAPKQAEVFATINFNQQKVDKSLAYQLFGYDLDATEPEYWAPDTLAISIVRILNNKDSSPFKNHISFGIADKQLRFNNSQEKKKFKKDPWTVSTSTMVEGVVRLLSSNPTEDRYILHKRRTIKKDRSVLTSVKRRSSEPLRPMYFSYKDAQLYDLVERFFRAVKQVLWVKSDSIHLLRKTIGIQALFELLKEICKREAGVEAWSQAEFEKRLDSIDLNKIAQLETNYSGVGKSQIKSVLLEIYNE